MRKVFLFIAFFLMTGMMIGAPKKTNLRVLYVGGHSNFETSLNEIDPATLNQSVADRTSSFEEFLKMYFTTVKVILAKDYRYQMSNDYDVTIMDGVPTPLKPRQDIKEGQRLVKRIETQYFPEDFDRPVITIAELGETLGRYIGLKNDWYCLCLDNYAHSMRTNHPIFKGPYKVNLKLEDQPTPEGALEFATLVGETLPSTIKMLKMSNSSYQQPGKNIKIGMVSRPWGYEDSPEAEWISSGKCAKSIDAMALGRHGAFFHWGFAAAPSDMTDAAKMLFLNTVVYISKFAGHRLIARKLYESISTRIETKESAFRLSRGSWENYKEDVERHNVSMKRYSDSLKAVYKEGDKLTRREQIYLQWKPQAVPTYEEWIKKYAGSLYEQYGSDIQAYAKYYEENAPYFYSSFNMRGLQLDEDAKSLGIPNNDVRILDKAILLWETTEDVAKGRRLLERYTLLHYDNPKQYRAWYLKYKDKLFFTESGGWKWLVNSQDKNVPGNDYSVLKYNEVPEQKTPEICGDTNRDNPVLISGVVNNLPDGDKELVIRVKMHNGFHIYGFVSDQDPYIATTFDIQTEGDWKKVGELQIPSFKNLGTTGTTIYEGDVLFRQRLKGSGKGKVTCTVNYQTCDEHACLPPRDVTLSLDLK